MENTLAKQSQFPFFARNSFNGLLSPALATQFNLSPALYPYLANYLPTLSSNVWSQSANQAPTCSSPISPSSHSTSGRCPICLIPMQGIDANQHFLEEVQKLETLRRNKENEEKCKMDIIDVDIENQNSEQGFYLQLAKRNSRFLTRYQTYLRIKQSREERKMRSYRTQKRRPDDKLMNAITPPGMSLGQLNQFSLSAAAAHSNLQNNLHLLQQQAAAQQHLANQQAAAQRQQQFNLNLNLLNAVAASCNSPATSNSNQTVCLENVESGLALSNGALSASHNASSTGLAASLANSLGNSLGNSQSNGQDRATPGSKSSTPLTALSSMNGGTLNGSTLNGNLNGSANNNNGNTTPNSTKTSSPVTGLSLNCSNNVVSSHTKTPPNSTIWSIASITGLNAVANNLQNLNSLNSLNNNLNSLANDNLKRRCLTDDEDEDLEITDVADDRDSISSYK